MYMYSAAPRQWDGEYYGSVYAMNTHKANKYESVLIKGGSQNKQTNKQTRTRRGKWMILWDQVKLYTKLFTQYKCVCDQTLHVDSGL